ncbi:MAG TPA: M23 family metallopeptidase [Bryobacteraceae bacterium]|nr:M23 family metallopeptidase [Bryobacteraceae bacterium]
MRARMAAVFAIGFAFGVLFLGVALWRSGSLAAVASRSRDSSAALEGGLPDQSQANRVVPPEAAYPPPSAGNNLHDLMSEAGKRPATPPNPPEPEPFEAPPSAPSAAPGAAAAPVPIGPRPPAPHGEADRTAPDRTPQPHLLLPLSGIDPKKLVDTFPDARGGRTHEALDIPAPRGTPVRAVAEGNVVKLFTSKQGGLTVYQFDDSRTWCYYYAHLDRYASGLTEGTLLRAGDVLGYVGSTGNASPATPHLHFAVFQLGPEKKWWEGTPIDPLPLLR